MKMSVEELLPTSQAVERLVQAKMTGCHCIRVFIQVEHPVVAPIDRNDDVDIEIGEDKASIIAAN